MASVLLLVQSVFGRTNFQLNSDISNWNDFIFVIQTFERRN